MFKKLIFIGVFFFTLTGFSKEYLVKLKPEYFTQSLMQFQSLKVQDQHPQGSLIKIDLSEDQVGALAQLLTRPEVDYVVPNFKLHAFRAPVEIQALKEQWHLVKVKAEKAWKLAKNKGSHEVLVAVIDTGVDYNHESLKPNMVAGYDFRNNDEDPMDETSARNPGHGTHCAGIIGATGLVDGGVSGIAPNISIMPLRFLGSDGSGDLMNGIKAIDYAIEKGAEVISASWGATVGKSQAQPLIDAVKRASDAGVIFVAAAANDGRNNDKTSVYPANANFENTITVAASGNSDEKPSWSNYGRASVQIASPGLNIMSTLPKNKYGTLSGTSMATPLVAGLVALLKSQAPNLTGAEILSILQSTGAKVSIETECNCRIDAEAAMQALLEKKAVIVPQAGTLEKQQNLKLQVLHGEGFKFESTNPAVATVSESGEVKAVSDGEFQIKASDASGIQLTSLKFYVGAKSGGDDGGGDNPLPVPGECPLDPQTCELLCQITPQLPWCEQ